MPWAVVRWCQRVLQHTQCEADGLNVMADHCISTSDTRPLQTVTGGGASYLHFTLVHFTGLRLDQQQQADRVCSAWTFIKSTKRWFRCGSLTICTYTVLNRRMWAGGARAQPASVFFPFTQWEYIFPLSASLDSSSTLPLSRHPSASVSQSFSLSHISCLELPSKLWVKCSSQCVSGSVCTHTY